MNINFFQGFGYHSLNSEGLRAISVFHRSREFYAVKNTLAKKKEHPNSEHIVSHNKSHAGPKSKH